MNQFLEKPTTDFGAVRDGRRSMPLWIDIDLSAARSISAGSALVVNIAGNSFFVDQDTTTVGTATVHFQDTNLGNASAPFFVSAGYIANVPFTQILIENAAQSGKRLRIFYGVDIDFQAGVNATISAINQTQVRKVFTSTEVTVNAADQQIVAASSQRDYLLIQNKHASATLYLRLDGATAVAGQGIVIAPGASIELSNTVPSNAVRGIASAAGCNIVVIEG